MFKKILLALGCMLTISPSFADTLPYMGVEFGLDRPSWRLTDTTGGDVTFSNGGAIGNFFAGIGGMANTYFYGAVEGFAGAASTRSSNKNISVNGTAAEAMMRERYSYGGSFIPALQLNRAIRIFGRIGGIRTRFELHQTVAPSGADSNLDRSTVTGGQLGIGIYSQVARTAALRAEYDYTSYRSFRVFHNKVLARDSWFKVALVYVFV